MRRMDAALARMRRRGPDDEGCEKFDADWGHLLLGHTRLSVIDLSSNGHQPMVSRDGRFLIVFNGEIYNYRELRDEINPAPTFWKTQSDTEVLVEAWMRWGVDALPRLTGMFAFCVFDRVEGTLTCVRDAFGIKPLFFSSQAGQFCFASELPALVALRGAGAVLNHQRAYDYLVHGDYDSTEETFVDGVYQLPPASWIRVDLTSREVAAPYFWWTPSIQEARIPFAEAAGQLRTKFLDSVRLHLRSDVPLGAALSGGLDSSAVVCAMRHLDASAAIHTFSFVPQGSVLSEEPWIRKVNDYIGATAHRIEVAPHELAEDLDDMILAQGEPFGSTSIYAQYRVFRLVRDCGVTVTLDGQGADELLAGYHGYVGRRLHSLIDEGRWLDASLFLKEWSRWPGRSLARGALQGLADLAGPGAYEAARRLSGFATVPEWLNAPFLREAGVNMGFPRQIPENDVPGRRVVAELALSSTRRGLPGLLRHADRNAMRFSVESRVPFLTTDLADFLFSLPESHLISERGETKSVLREAMRGLVPDEILQRRDKVSFATPEQEWLRLLAPRARGWIEEAADLPLLNKQAVLREFDQVMSGQRAFSWQVWRWVNFYRWHDLVLAPLAKA